MKKYVFVALAFLLPSALVVAMHPAIASELACSLSVACYGGNNASTGPGVQGDSTKGNGIVGQTKSLTGNVGVAGIDLSTTYAGNIGVRGLSSLGGGVYGASTSSSTKSYGVKGASAGAGPGVWGVSSGSGSNAGTVGVYGYSANAGVSGQGTLSGVQGASTNGTGVIGQNLNYNGNGVQGSGSTGVLGSGGNYGVYGTGTYGVYGTGSYGLYGTGGSYGVYGNGYNYGLYGSGNNGYGVFAVGSFGAYLEGYSYGVYADNYNSGTAVYGTGSTGIYGYGSSYGVTGYGSVTGVTGQVAQGTGGTAILAQSSSVAGLLFRGNNSNNKDVFYVDNSGNVHAHSFTADITTTAITRPLYAEQVGTSSLVQGSGIVRFPASATASVSHGYTVFLTPQGDTHGLYVAQKTAQGFVVRENMAGHSTVSFDYRVVPTEAPGTSANVQQGIIAGNIGPRGPAVQVPVKVTKPSPAKAPAVTTPKIKLVTAPVGR